MDKDQAPPPRRLHFWERSKLFAGRLCRLCRKTIDVWQDDAGNFWEMCRRCDAP